MFALMYGGFGMKHLICGLAAWLLIAVSAHADPGAWQSRDQVSQLDGTHEYLALVPADNSVATNRDRQKKPILAVIWSRRLLTVRIVWPDHIVPDASYSFAMNFLWKLDDGVPQKADWSVDTKFAFSTVGEDAVHVLQSWKAGKVLVVRVPDGHGNQEAVFRIDGLDQVFDQVKKDIVADVPAKP